MSPPEGAQPKAGAAHFVCPNCGVDAEQVWHEAGVPRLTKQLDADLRVAQCRACDQRNYWVKGELVAPRAPFGPEPNEGLEGSLLDLYEEARAIGQRSPKGAAALLRLLVEQLVDQVGASGKTLHDRINNLAGQGLMPQHAVQALHAVRVVGNNAVHAGEIDPAGDDHSVVLVLLRIVNLITEAAITLPRQSRELLGDRATPTS